MTALQLHPVHAAGFRSGLKIPAVVTRVMHAVTRVMHSVCPTVFAFDGHSHTAAHLWPVVLKTRWSYSSLLNVIITVEVF